jgi:hypothetical protein
MMALPSARGGIRVLPPCRKDPLLLQGAPSLRIPPVQRIRHRYPPRILAQAAVPLMQSSDGLELRGQGRAKHPGKNRHAVLGTLATPNPDFAAIEVLDPEGQRIARGAIVMPWSRTLVSRSSVGWHNWLGADKSPRPCGAGLFGSRREVPEAQIRPHGLQ